MTPREAQILRDLVAAAASGEPWARPMDFGGGANTDHGTVAKRMVPKSWVELFTVGPIIIFFMLASGSH